MSEVPEILAAFAAAINRGDTAAFLDFFTEDGEVNDWGRRFIGRDAIRKWSDAETIGAHGTLTVTDVLASSPERIEADTYWKSEAFTGPGRFVFTLADGKIRELRISEA
ncbi:MAG TPA: nuclear transport factor 2 family protein [Devosia sp.]|nr:nuclear transport factor 2 family protein [Devosia sp.]